MGTPGIKRHDAGTVEGICVWDYIGGMLRNYPFKFLTKRAL